MDLFESILLERTFLGNRLLDWAIVAGLLVGVYAVLAILRTLIAGRLEKLAARTATSIDDLVVAVIRRTGLAAAIGVWCLVGNSILELPDDVAQAARVAGLVALLFQAGLWASAAIGFAVKQQRARAMENHPGAVTTIDAVGFIARLVSWSIALLLLLDNLGINISALVTGLGIGGIAIALAVQNILGDLLASLAIVFDKPFEHGDFIIVGDFLGTIERVGLKTTRVRSLSGEQLIFSNADLLGSRIRNYKRMRERRVAFSIGVVYQTPHDDVAAIPGMLREIVEAQDKVRFDRAHFKQFGDSALEFEIVYYVLGADYNLYMDIQQAINLGISARFAEHGIQFAYPTRTLYLAGDGAGDGRRDDADSGDEADTDPDARNGEKRS
ncbi:MAG: mechanosensitive ion channel family protein [Candidatus Eiseniibacteriota bacterium]|jgi:small-conductance mechanosensitive channel